MKIAPMTLSYTAPPTTSIAGIPGATACTEATVTENNWFLVSDASYKPIVCGLLHNKMM